MSRKGENIYKRKDGRWEARYIKTYSAEGKAIYGYCYAPTYRDVREKVSRVKAGLSFTRSASEKNARISFAVCCDEWLQLNRLKVKESTYVKYSGVIRKHIRPRLGEYQISAITSIAVEEFSHTLLHEEKLSAKTVKDVLVILKSILNYTGRHYGGIAADIEVIYPKEVRKEMRVLTQEEQRRFTEYLLSDMDNIRFGVLLTLMTGLRIGEICALRWADISLDEKVIRVGATMQRLRNTDETGGARTRIVISDPKSGASRRMIPLTDRGAELCGMFGVQRSDAFVLSGSSEHIVEPRQLQYHLKRLTAACGLEGVHYHTLRHSFATRCVEVDFEIKTLSEILGHASPKITLERYVHTSLELKRNNMNKLALIGY